MKQNSLPLKQWISKGLTIAFILALLSTGYIFIHSSSATKYVIHWDKFNYLALAAACLALVGSWLLEALRIYLILTGLGEKISLKRIMGINLATTFTGNITPFYSGGVPTQIYLFCRDGIQAGKASAIVTMRVILSTLVFTTIVPFLLLFYNRKFSFGPIHQVTSIAIPIAFIVSGLLIGFIINPKLAKALFVAFIKKFSANRWVQKLVPALERIIQELDVFHESIRQFRHGINFYLTLLCSFLYWALFFSIAPFVMFALGINAAHIFLEIIVFQFILVFIISYLPIPGGSGVMELSFYSILVFIPSNLRAMFVLFWRFLSYYLTTFVGGVVLLRIMNQPARPTVDVLN